MIRKLTYLTAALLMTGMTAVHALEPISLNTTQVEALGLKFETVSPVQQVKSYAWPGQVDIPLAHRDMLSAPVSGRIHAVHFVHGEVKKGQPLITLYSTELVTMQQRWLDARAQQAQAQKNFARAERLYQAGSLSQKQYLAAKTALAQAEHAQTAAYDALRYAGLQADQLKTVARTGKPVALLTLRAPKDGLFFDLQVERNQEVPAQAVLGQIGEIEEVIVDVAVPVAQARTIEVGQPVTLVPDAVQGKVRYVAQQADPMTQRVAVHVLFENAERKLLPGQFVRVQFVKAAPVQSWRVPSHAVVALEGAPSVFVHVGEVFKPVQVEMISRNADWAIVRSPALKAGIEVVSYGAIFLKGMMGDEEEGGAGNAH